MGRRGLAAARSVSATIATFLAWMVRVVISPEKPVWVWVKLPMVAMVVILSSGCSRPRPCGLDGVRRAGGDRRRTRAAGRSVSGGRRGQGFLLREEPPQAVGKKPGIRRFGGPGRPG